MICMVRAVCSDGLEGRSGTYPECARVQGKAGVSRFESRLLELPERHAQLGLVQGAATWVKVRVRVRPRYRLRAELRHVEGAATVRVERAEERIDLGRARLQPRRKGVGIGVMIGRGDDRERVINRPKVASSVGNVRENLRGQ